MSRELHLSIFEEIHLASINSQQNLVNLQTAV
jgi:hypothetical protein